MPVTLGSNILSLRAQRRLEENSSSLSQVYERLSSGMRINRASDDPAGLAVSAKLSSDARVYTQALANVNDGISTLNIAQGALEQLSSIITRQKELAEQAANGLYSLTQRRALNAEADALTSEYNRIIETTKFNGINLLNSANNTLSIQAGTSSSDAIILNLGTDLARTTGDGSLSTPTLLDALSGNILSKYLTDINGDGTLDIVADTNVGSIGVYLGNGNGSFRAPVQYFGDGAGAAGFGGVYIDLNSDDIEDFVVPGNASAHLEVFMGNSDGSFAAVRTYDTAQSESVAQSVADINNDGHLDIVAGSYTGGGVVSILLGNGNGTFQAATSFIQYNTEMLALKDLNADGKVDLIINNYSANYVGIRLGNGDGTFQETKTYTLSDNAPDIMKIADVNHDGLDDLIIGSQATTGSIADVDVLLGNGDSTFKAAVNIQGVTTGSPSVQGLAVVDLNGDGNLDVVASDYLNGYAHVALGNGNGTFSATISYTSGGIGKQVLDFAAADLNGDGAADLITNQATSLQILFGNTRQVTTLARFDLLTAEGARTALTTLTETHTRVEQQLATIGAYQSRLSSAATFIGTYRNELRNAESRIRDVDVAEETSLLVRNQILQQAQSAILAQANQQPMIALRLISPISAAL